MKNVIRIIVLLFTLSTGVQHAFSMQNMLKRSLFNASRATMHTRPKTVPATLSQKNISSLATPTLRPLKTPLLTQQKRSILSTSYFKGIYDILPEKYKHLSPLFGATAYESNYLRRMYEFGDTNDATTQLARQFFNITPVSERFRQTQLTSLPGFWLTPESIGYILGALQTGTVDRPELLECIQKSAPHVKTKKIKELLTSITRAQTESKDFYPAQTVPTLLLTLLYLKATNKQHILEYFNALSTQLSDFKTTENMRTTFLQENYSTRDYHYIKTTKDTDVNTLLSELYTNPEIAFAQTIKTVQSESTLPPQVPQGSYGYNGQKPAPDCVETMLRDFCNILLYNPETKIFDFGMLPATIKPRQEFIDFYTHNPNPLEKSAGQAWMNLVSNHQNIGVTYNRGNYEINPSVQNIFTLISHFFNVNVQNCRDLSKVFSDQRRVVQCTPKQTSDNNATISVTINSDHAVQCAMHITSGHGYLRRLARQAENNPYHKFNDLHYANLKTQQQLTRNDKNLADNMLPFSQNVKIDDVEECAPPLLNLFTFSSDLSNANDRLHRANMYLMWYSRYKHDKKQAEKIIATLTRNLPDDYHFYSELGRRILDNNLHTNPELRRICEKLNSIDLVKACVHNESAEVMQFIDSRINIKELTAESLGSKLYDYDHIAGTLLHLYSLPTRDAEERTIIITIIKKLMEQLLSENHGSTSHFFHNAAKIILKHHIINEHPLFATIVNRSPWRGLLKRCIPKGVTNQVTQEEELWDEYAYNKRMPIITKLINAGAFPNEAERFYDYALGKKSLLVKILKDDNTNVLKKYIQKLLTTNKRDALNYFVKENDKDQEYKTPLCYARSPEAVTLMLQGGAQPRYERNNIVVNAQDHLTPGIALFLTDDTTKPDPVQELSYNT